MGVKVTNNAFGTLSAAINTTVTTITLDSGQGARFPTLGASDYFYATLVDTSNNLEIVKVTARSTDSLTVVRGQDGTTATSFAIGDRFELRPVAALFDDIIDNASVDGIASSSTSGTAIQITSGNDVGFGTTAPNPTQVAVETGGGNKGVMLARNASGGGSPTNAQDFGSFGWKGIMDGTNSMSAAEAKIVATAAENHSGTAAGTNMDFYTKEAGVGPGSAPAKSATISHDRHMYLTEGYKHYFEVVKYWNRPTSAGSYSSSESTAMQQASTYVVPPGNSGMIPIAVINTRAFQNYVCVKTNLTSNNVMFQARFQGYMYGYGLADANYGGYTYSSGGYTVLSKAQYRDSNAGSQYIADAYRTSAGHLCFKIYLGHTGYTEGQGTFWFGGHGDSWRNIQVDAVQIRNDGTNHPF